MIATISETTDYCRMMTTAIQNADPSDRISSNLALVVFLANRFLTKYSNVDRDELICAGNYGLFKAADKFDETKNIRFSTYASTIINREFLKCMVASQNRGVHIPRKTYEHVELVSEFVSQHGRLPMLQEMALLLERKVKLSQERYQEIINAYTATLPFVPEGASEDSLIADGVTVDEDYEQICAEFKDFT